MKHHKYVQKRTMKPLDALGGVPATTTLLLLFSPPTLLPTFGAGDALLPRIDSGRPFFPTLPSAVLALLPTKFSWEEEAAKAPAKAVLAPGEWRCVASCCAKAELLLLV